MENILVLLLLLLFSDTVYCQCTFEADLIGTWKSNVFGTITVTTNILTLGEHQFNINGKTTTNWTCYTNATSPYVVIRSELFTLNTDDTYAFICMTTTEQNINSFIFYMNSPTLSLMNNERIAVYAAASIPGNIAAGVCTDVPSPSEFISMVRSGSESGAVVDCPDPLHRNFTYILNTGGSNLCADDSFVSICPGRQQFEFDYTKCSGNNVFYSSGGRVGCVASIDGGSGTWYASLYNFDTSVNDLTTFRFTCMAIQDVSSGDVQTSYNVKRCSANQAYNVRPTPSGGLLTLTPNGTCEITTTTSTTTTTTEEQTTTAITSTSTTTETPVTWQLTTDSVNVGAIIGGVLGAMALILIILFLVLYCIHRNKVIAKQREIIDRRLKLFKIKQVQGLDDDEKVLTEPSLDPDFPHTLERPKQELIPPVKKSITRDMMSQTDLQEAKKKPKPPSVIEKPKPTPTPKYLPWPWRTAKRACQKTTFGSQTNLNKFGPLTETAQDCISLANYTVANYGLKYDDTGVDEYENKISRPPTRFIPRTQSFLSLSKASVKHSISRSSSVSSLHRSTSMEELKTPTPRTVQISRTSSLKSLPSFTERTQTHVLMSIQEKETKEKTHVQSIDRRSDMSIRPIPHYMFPIRSNTVSKFDKEKKKNPLFFPLKRSKTELRPIPNKSKKKPVKTKKKKKIKVIKKKKSPYAVIQTPLRQITLVPLSRQKNTKVKPADVKHKPSKSVETNSTVEGTFIKSPKTTESIFTQSPDTLSSNDTLVARKMEPPISKSDQLGNEPEVQSESRPVVENQAMRRIQSKADFQDSGISADESSLEKPKSEYGNKEQLKLPVLSVSDKPEAKVHNSTPQTEELKLPFLEKQQKTTVRPWR